MFSKTNNGNQYNKNNSNWLISNYSKFIKMEGSNSVFKRMPNKKDRPEHKVEQSR